MLTLITFPAGFNEPSYSPFCSKAIYLLQMAGVEWERKDVNDPRKSPRGQLPVLVDGSRQIPDSEAIRRYLEKEYNADFDAGLTAAEKAVACAFTRLAENHLRQFEVYDRWLDDANWTIIREMFFGQIPGWIRGFVTGKIRKSVHDKLVAEGVARLDKTERLEWASRDLDAIQAWLGDKPFLFGDKPTSADASVVAVMGGIINMPAQTDLSKAINNRASLCAYTERMKTTVDPVGL